MKCCTAWLLALSILTVAAVGPAVAQTEPAAQASRLGIGWAFVYGYQGVPAERFVPEVRRLGGGFSKVYLFWNQLEPTQGEYDWSAADAYVDQLRSPDEGLIALFSSSTWATQRSSEMIPASPPKNPDEYYRLVHELVSRYRGRVRYWQNDCEPNNPVYWSGTKEEFVDQLKVFSKAVKNADPEAIVIAGGYDGLFNPPSMFPMYNQQVGLAFFDHVLDAGRDAFDVFDLRLYADPYTIPGRVRTIRKKMEALGYSKPIIATEYGGPGFFEFPANLRYIPMVVAWSQAATSGAATHDPSGGSIADLYSQMDSLAPQTQMFLMGCAPELDAKFQRLQSREIAVRNILALYSGVERTAYWQLMALSLPRDNLMQLMYGKVGMLTYENGKVANQYPIADAFARTAHALAGVRTVKRVDVPGQPNLFFFEFDRAAGEPGYAVWERRDTFTGEDQPPTEASLPWAHGKVTAGDVLGNKIAAHAGDQSLRLPVSAIPIFIELQQEPASDRTN